MSLRPRLTLFALLVSLGFASRGLTQSTSSESANLKIKIEDQTASALVKWKGKKRTAESVDRVVVHCVAALNTPDGAERPLADWFDREHIVAIWTKYKVGPHYVIERDGTISQWVDDLHTAYHASVYNSRSIGIELVGLNDEKWVKDRLKAKVTDEAKRDELRSFTKPQYKSLNGLLDALAKKYKGAKAITHADIYDRAVVGASGARLRTKPSLKDGEIKETLPAGVELVLKGGRVDAEGHRWYSVRTPDKKKSGWVAKVGITRQQRKHDPGAAFDKADVLAMDFVDSGDF